ncbi:MAG: FKBP-type peptidyl-prolyl cis-trans isomerase [Candidatus Spyradosoma sp.]
MIRNIIPILGMLAVAPFVGAEENAAVPATQTQQETPKKAEISAEKKALFLKIVGCISAAQNGLELAELTPEESAAAIEGFRLGLAGKTAELEDALRADRDAFGAFMQDFEGKIRAKAAEKAQAARKKISDENRAKGAAYIEKCKEDKAYVALPSGVLVKVEKAGDDTKKPTPESYIAVRYTGKLVDGAIFDSSERAEGEPVPFTDKSEPAAFPFPLGQLIPGWIEALQTLGVGAKATLVIPADQAYGDSGRLPPGSTLVFDIELVSVSDKAPERPQEEEDEDFDLPEEAAE